MTQENYEVQIINQEITDFDLNFKIIIIGDSGVGKSCLSLRATKNVFENLYSPTIGFEFMTFFIKVDNKAIKLQIWDTCGQEIYRSLISSFYNSSSIFNLNSFSTFFILSSMFFIILFFTFSLILSLLVEGYNSF